MRSGAEEVNKYDEQAVLSARIKRLRRRIKNVGALRLDLVPLLRSLERQRDAVASEPRPEDY